MFVVDLSRDDVYKILRAIKRTMYQIHAQRRIMPRRCANEASQLLRGNINKQAFTPYTRYTKRYAKWKREQGYPSMFWKLSGDLIRAIRVHRVAHTEWFAGISDSAMDSGGKSYGKGRRVPIGMYANILEYGGKFPQVNQEHPPRPVFVPTAQQYRKGGLMLKQADKSFKKIASKWR